MNKQAKLSQHLALPSEAALSHSSKLDGIHLSPHFTLGELTKTNVKGINNEPPHAAVLNLRNLCENWLEDLRYSYNTLYCLKPGEDYETSKNVEPIIINSGFRSEAVNKAIGGVKGSNHLTGCAVDIRCLGIEQAIRYACILLDMADGTKRDLTSSRVCSRLAESMQAPLSARSNADFDELLIERSPKGTYWIHFAVRPKDNRMKVRFIKT